MAETVSGPARDEAHARASAQVLGLLADGYQGPEIAEQLFLSLETVRTHIRNAVGKLGARTRVQAAAMVACARGGSRGRANAKSRRDSEGNSSKIRPQTRV